MRFSEASEKYEGKTLLFTGGRTDFRLRVVSIIEPGGLFVTAMVQRINKDGSVDARDFNQARERSFAHSAVSAVQ